MKASRWVVLLLIATGMAVAGPSSPDRFSSSRLRQDLTGQGTYHRIGLIRQQDRAVRAQKRREAAVKEPRPRGFLARIWNSIFPKKTNPSHL